jgi:transposase InsO family protein
MPVCFASHSLNQAQRNYATNEKEALACLWACEKWEKFLLGRHFTLRTDHRPLTFLLKKHWQGRQSAKFVRWNDRLAQFDFQIEYRPGAENDVADFLSRHPASDEQSFEDDQDNTILIRRVAEDGISVDIIREATASDRLLQRVIKFVETQWPQKVHQKDLKPFFHLRHLLSVEQGCLLREERLVLPVHLSKRLLRLAHAGHPGIVRMKRKLRETYWWPSMNNDIDHFVRHCQACQCSEKSFKPNVVPRMEIPVPDTAWSKVAIDIAGPYFTAPVGRRFIVTIIDYYSKFPEVLLTDTTTSLSIIKWLEEVFARYGNPDELVSDNGPQFVSHEFQYFLKSRNVKHHRASVYTPQQNGLVEVFNRFLKHGIQAFYGAHTSWDQGILELLAHYRATAPSANKESPCELMFGRKMRLPFEVSMTNPCSITNTPVIDQAATSLTGRGPYKRGEWVCVRRPHVLKGQSPFSNPMKVIDVLGNWTYRLSDNQVWNARRMRRHFQTQDVDPDDFTAVVQRRCSPRSTKGKPPERFSP